MNLFRFQQAALGPALVVLLTLSACQEPHVTRRGSLEISQAREAAALSFATLGQPVPDFELESIDGSRVRLSDYLGRVVIIEWFNPACPFTTHAHEFGLLKGYPDSVIEQGVVWLAINSAAKGKMGGSLEQNLAARDAWSLNYPVLLDPSGEVGRRFDATTTPEVFLIDPAGVLVYVGALDNMPFGKVRGGGEGQNYVDEALQNVLADQAVRSPQRQPYGSRVKYAQPTLGN